MPKEPQSEPLCGAFLVMIKWYKNYMGYVREGLTYSTYPFRSKSDPTTKFVIFTVGRSGSGLLVNLLQSHAHVHCDDELFQRKLVSPFLYLKSKARLARKDVYGFKLNTYHFRIQKIEYPVEFVGKIQRAGYKIISLKRAYHGVSYGALSASGFEEDKLKFGPMVPGFVKIEPPYCYRCPFKTTYPECALLCAEHLENVIKEENPDTIAAFIMEPVMGFGGVIVPPKGYMQKVSDIC